jgi:hypothetical protein
LSGGSGLWSLLQRGQCALILALETGLIAVQKAERWAVARKMLEGERNQLRRRLAAIFLVGSLLIDVLVEDARLNAGEAGHAPGDGGELMNEVERGGGAGLEMRDVSFEAGLEFLGWFGGEDDRLRGEAVADRIAGGGAKSSLGFRPAGFGAVGAGGFDAAEGGHAFCLIEDKARVASRERAAAEFVGGAGDKSWRAP